MEEQAIIVIVPSSACCTLKMNIPSGISTMEEVWGEA